MKFNEKNASYYKINSGDKQQSLYGHIYFLIKDGEVVYVGQTKKGISRPLAHTDKDFDSFYMKRCRLSVLDKRETEMIIKYKPKYNYNFINNNSFIAITNIKNRLWKQGIEIRTFFIERESQKLGIVPISIKFSKSYKANETKKLENHLKKHWLEIKKEQEQSLQKTFISQEEDVLFLNFVCSNIKFDDYRWLGEKSIKDLYYMGKFTQKDIDFWVEKYNKQKGE